MTTHKSVEFKQALVRKFVLSSLSIRQFAKQEGLPVSTLHKWKELYWVDEFEVTQRKNSDGWSVEQKFAVVLESAPLSEVELGEYCRGKGLYPEQVKHWKLSCVQGNMTDKDREKRTAAQAKADKKRIKELEKELRRKDKALAEAAAILVLRKKLNALWEEEEED
jgi:transposase-like protein